MTRPRVLVVAGHDSSGRAGLDADRQALEHFGAEIAPVVSTWTRQEGARVLASEPRPIAEWSQDVREVQAEVHAWKSGVLAGADAVCAFAALVGELAGDRPVVCDPVLAASGGEAFLDAAGVAVLRDELLPRGVYLTPNLPEAARLAGVDGSELVNDLDARVAAATKLLDHGARGVVLKGGHGRETPAADLVLGPGREAVWVRHSRVSGAALRGSGCRHASAIAALLARGETLASAAREAGAWLTELLGAQAVGDRPSAR